MEANFGSTTATTFTGDDMTGMTDELNRTRNNRASAG
jgi:hypothetical protein